MTSHFFYCRTPSKNTQKQKQQNNIGLSLSRLIIKKYNSLSVHKK